ncbi:MAG: GNAT family N-acetyltransferase [Christensenellales bacterium]|jgi:ribosomal protein S18 acetylase RimI-like enzyme
MMHYDIFEVDRGDLAGCAEVIRAGFATVAEAFGLTEENCPTNGAFIRLEHLQAHRLRGDLMYGLSRGGRMIGFMQLEKQDERTWELEKLTVLPQVRRRGYGKILLDFAKEQVIALGGSVLTVGIIEENTWLKNWYLRHGFIHTGTRSFDHLPFVVGFMRWSK